MLFLQFLNKRYEAKMTMKESIKNDNAFLRAILDAIPSPVLIMNRNLRIIDANQAAKVLSPENPVIQRKLCGDMLCCYYALTSGKGCGSTEHCRECIVRRTVRSAVKGEKSTREKGQMAILRNGATLILHLLVTATPFTDGNRRLALVILEDITELVELRSIFRICASCKRIRRDDEYWEQIETFLKTHLDLQFSHGICPECTKNLYPDLGLP